MKKYMVWFISSWVHLRNKVRTTTHSKQ